MVAADRTEGGGHTPASGAGSSDWPYHGNDLGANRYVNLDQIEAGNVGGLEIVWRWTSPDQAIRESHPELRSFHGEAIPVAVGGGLFTVTSFSQLAALDAGTGEALWTAARADLERLPTMGVGELQVDSPYQGWLRRPSAND